MNTQKICEMLNNSISMFPTAGIHGDDHEGRWDIEFQNVANAHRWVEIMNNKNLPASVRERMGRPDRVEAVLRDPVTSLDQRVVLTVTLIWKGEPATNNPPADAVNVHTTAKGDVFARTYILPADTDWGQMEDRYTWLCGGCSARGGEHYTSMTDANDAVLDHLDCAH